MSDLVKRLEADAEWNSAPQVDLDLPVTAALEREAAAEIERLTAELAAAKAMTNQGWDKYCELRKWLADQKYPNMDEEVRAALTDTKE